MGFFLGPPSKVKTRKNLEKETFGGLSLAIEELTDLQDARGSAGNVSGPGGPRCECQPHRVTIGSISVIFPHLPNGSKSYPHLPAWF